MTEQVGSIGDEAAKLLGAAQEWARATFGELPLDAEHIATGAPECGYCPLCRLIAVLRGDRPEVTERLAAAGTAALAALRTLFDAAAEPGPAPPRPQRVQHIDLDEPAAG